MTKTLPQTSHEPTTNLSHTSNQPCPISKNNSTLPQTSHEPTSLPRPAADAEKKLKKNLRLS